MPAPLPLPRECAVVNELIAEGVTGERLVRVVQELTGLLESDALQLIAIETGRSTGDIVCGNSRRSRDSEDRRNLDD